MCMYYVLCSDTFSLQRPLRVPCCLYSLDMVLTLYEVLIVSSVEACPIPAADGLHQTDSI